MDLGTEASASWKEADFAWDPYSLEAMPVKVQAKGRDKKGGLKNSKSGHHRRSACQVPGCTSDLTNAKAFYRKCGVCVAHASMLSVHVGNDKLVRFCQQCGRLHDLALFDGDKKSCREQLEKHNLLRRQERAASRQKRLSEAQRNIEHAVKIKMEAGDKQPPSPTPSSPLTARGKRSFGAEHGKHSTSIASTNTTNSSTDHQSSGLPGLGAINAAAGRISPGASSFDHVSPSSMQAAAQLGLSEHPVLVPYAGVKRDMKVQNGYSDMQLLAGQQECAVNEMHYLPVGRSSFEALPEPEISAALDQFFDGGDNIAHNGAQSASHQRQQQQQQQQQHFQQQQQCLQQQQQQQQQYYLQQYQQQQQQQRREAMLQPELQALSAHDSYLLPPSDVATGLLEPEDMLSYAGGMEWHARGLPTQIMQPALRPQMLDSEIMSVLAGDAPYDDLMNTSFDHMLEAFAADQLPLQPMDPQPFMDSQHDMMGSIGGAPPMAMHYPQPSSSKQWCSILEIDPALGLQDAPNLGVPNDLTTMMRPAGKSHGWHSLSYATAADAFRAAQMAGIGASTASPGFDVEMAVTRICIKLHNCTPNQLPTHMHARLREVVANAGLQIVQGFIRPGCVHLTIDLLDIAVKGHSAEECSLERIAAGLTMPLDRSLIIALGEHAVSRRKVVVQGSETVMLLDNGCLLQEAELQSSWPDGAAPNIELVEPICVTASGFPATFKLYGSSLCRPGISVFVRSQGKFLTAEVEQSLACEDSVSHIKVTLQSAPVGLLVFECMRDDCPAVLGNWKAAVVVESHVVASELRQLETDMQEMASNKDASWQLSQLVVSLGMLLQTKQGDEQGDFSLNMGTAVSEDGDVFRSDSAEVQVGHYDITSQSSNPGSSSSLSLSTSSLYSFHGDSASEAEGYLIGRMHAQRTSPRPHSIDHPLWQPAYAGRALAAAQQLLAYSCKRGWPAMVGLSLSLLRVQGISFCQVAQDLAAAHGRTMLHYAVASGSIPTLQMLKLWARISGMELNYGHPGKDGLTPLHLAAALPDHGAVAQWILINHPGACCIWLTATAGMEKSTPAHFAKANGCAFLNQLAYKQLLHYGAKPVARSPAGRQAEQRQSQSGVTPAPAPQNPSPLTPAPQVCMSTSTLSSNTAESHASPGSSTTASSQQLLRPAKQQPTPVTLAALQAISGAASRQDRSPAPSSGSVQHGSGRLPTVPRSLIHSAPVSLAGLQSTTEGVSSSALRVSSNGSRAALQALAGAAGSRSISVPTVPGVSGRAPSDQRDQHAADASSSSGSQAQQPESPAAHIAPTPQAAAAPAANDAPFACLATAKAVEFASSSTPAAMPDGAAAADPSTAAAGEPAAAAARSAPVLPHRRHPLARAPGASQGSSGASNHAAPAPAVAGAAAAGLQHPFLLAAGATMFHAACTLPAQQSISGLAAVAAILTAAASASLGKPSSSSNTTTTASTSSPCTTEPLQQQLHTVLDKLTLQFSSRAAEEAFVTQWGTSRALTDAWAFGALGTSALGLAFTVQPQLAPFAGIAFATMLPALRLDGALAAWYARHRDVTVMLTCILLTACCCCLLPASGQDAGLPAAGELGVHVSCGLLMWSLVVLMHTVRVKWLWSAAAQRLALAALSEQHTPGEMVAYFAATALMEVACLLWRYQHEYRARVDFVKARADKNAGDTSGN